ncbi:class I SAM-dependent methyltransferase, partial [bacterium]
MRARVISPERLDTLPPDAPEALGSRRDLARINAVMGSPRVAARLLGSPAPRRVLEVGAGDGNFLLRTLRRVDHPIEVSRATLLDHQDTFSPNVIGHYGRINWGVETVVADAFEHLNEARTGPFDAIVANMFLHHFEDDRLAELLRLIAAKTERFV